MKHPHLKTPCLFLLCISAVMVTCCKPEKTEGDLVKDFRKLDGFLRRDQFTYDSLLTLMEELQKGFGHSDTKHSGYDAWNRTVYYKWNSDSTLALINAHKTYPKGFSRETIIHSGDSILFLHRFSTEPLGLQNRENFTFLESVFYLTPTGTVKHLARIRYNQRELEDTIAFRTKPFADLTDDISHYYSLELNYSRTIFSD